MKRSIPRIVCVALILLMGGEKLFATDVGGIICTNTTWNLAGSPYIVTGSSGIVIGCNATLTIETGVVVKFNPTLAIVVGSNAFGNGCLVARGTTESPIIFTSIKDPCNILDPARPGDWSRIHFTDYAVDAVFDAGNYVSGCILEHVIVEYAGYGNYGAVFAEKSSPFLNYCEVRHNLYYGIQVDGTNAPFIKITNCEVWDHSQCGITISGGSDHKLLNNNIHDNRGGGISFNSSGNTLIGNTISDNTGGDGGGIYFHCWSGGNTLTGNTISGNTSGRGGGIFFWNSGSDTLTENTISGNTASGDGGGICFWGPGSNTLTGNTISGNTSGGSGGGICFYASGSMTLTGNTITGNTAGGSGGGLYFGGSGGSTLTRNAVQTNTSKNGLGAVHLSGSGDTVFSQNVITNNYIVTGTTGGIYITNSERVSLAGDPDTGAYNIICGNDGYQVYNNNPFNADGRNDVNAVYVRWGTCDIQQTMAGIFDYFDDATRAFVIFYPFVCVIPGDFDFDQDVDLLDLETFVENWLRQDCAIPDWCEGTDLDLSTNVDFVDFAYFAENWLFGVGP